MFRACFLVLVAPLLVPGSDDAVIPEAAAPRVYTEPHKVTSGDDWYWLRFPLTYSPRRPAPLLILLHDRVEENDDAGRACVRGPLAAAFHERGWIVAVPSMMKRHRPTWADAGDYLVSLAQRLRKTYVVSAVLLAGLSAGGTAALQYGLKNPWEFDGLAALGGSASPQGGPEGRSLPLLIPSAADPFKSQGYEDVVSRPFEGRACSASEVQAAAAWAASRLPAFLRRRDLRAERIRAWKGRCASVEDWLGLGEWCRIHRFETDAVGAFEKAVQAGPDSPRARQAAGHVRVGDRWMPREEMDRNPVLPDGREVRRLSAADRAAALESAQRALLSPRPEVRHASAFTLGVLAQESSIEALLRALRAETEPSGIPVLQEALARHKPRAVAAELQKWAGDPKIDLDEKGWALEVIERLPADAGLPAALAFYFLDEKARPAARCVLAGAGEAALGRLAPLLAERDPKNLALVLDAAGEIRSRRVAPALAKLLEHPDARVRESSQGALLKLGAPAVPCLVEALDGPGHEAAEDLLHRLTGEKGGGDRQKWAEWIRRHRAEIDVPERP
jgi:poly(3-hydroxybutyrate) depolymerase